MISTESRQHLSENLSQKLNFLSSSGSRIEVRVARLHFDVAAALLPLHVSIKKILKREDECLYCVVMYDAYSNSLLKLLNQYYRVIVIISTI